MGTKANRRKAVRCAPRPPRFEVDWRALVAPPMALLGVYALFLGGKALLDRPIERLVVESSFQRVSAIQIEAAVADALGEGFLSVDLDALRRRVQALDWVDRARVGRVWPSSLLIQVAEHRAAARWGEDGLLNERGELFTQSARYDYPELPRLDGPSGRETEVAALYLALRGPLAEASLTLETLRMDARGALDFVLAGGQQVRLGRSDVEERVARFFDVVAPALRNDLRRVQYVDLRYTNGFAVGWLEPPATELARGGESTGRG